MAETVTISGTVTTENKKLETTTSNIYDEVDKLSDIIESTIEKDEKDNTKSIRQTILNDTIGIKNKNNDNKITYSYFDKPFKVQISKPDYFDPVILNDKTMRTHYVRSLAFEVAKDLYTYVDFNKVKSNRDWAKECITRAVDFAEVYLTYIVKGLDLSFSDVDWEKPAPVVSIPDVSDLKDTINNSNTNNSENTQPGN